jgi:hypothetical protein
MRRPTQVCRYLPCTWERRDQGRCFLRLPFGSQAGMISRATRKTRSVTVSVKTMRSGTLSLPARLTLGGVSAYGPPYGLANINLQVDRFGQHGRVFRHELSNGHPFAGKRVIFTSWQSLA